MFANQLGFLLDVGETKFDFHGLPITIETPKGEVRHGKGWSHISPADYGYIDGTTGADGDDVDCYVGPDNSSNKVWVVDQNHLGSNDFDEHKVMLGYNTERAAKNDYLKGHTDGIAIFRGITPMTMDKLKEWLPKDHLKPVGK